MTLALALCGPSLASGSPPLLVDDAERAEAELRRAARVRQFLIGN